MPPFWTFPARNEQEWLVASGQLLEEIDLSSLRWPLLTGFFFLEVSVAAEYDRLWGGALSK